MNVGNIVVEDTYLSSDNHDIGYMGSANKLVNIKFLGENLFEDLVKEVLVTRGTRDIKSIRCDVDWSSNPAVAKLPLEAFKKEGPIWISIAGYSIDGTVITTNALRLEVSKSNPIASIDPEPSEVIQKLIMDSTKQYMDLYVWPKLNALITESSNQQKKVLEATADARRATKQATSATAEAIKIVEKAQLTLSNEKQLKALLNEIRASHGDIKEKHAETIDNAAEASEALSSVTELIRSAAVGLSADMVLEVKRYYELACELNNGITANIDCGNPYSLDKLDCDGGTPYTTEAIKIDCGTPLSL